VVLDTDVVVAGIRSPQGASAALLRSLPEGNLTLLLSVALVLEYEDVCQRAEHRLATGMSAVEVDGFVNALVSFAEPVEIHFRWRPALRDAGDEMVLETAVNGAADAIVTFNVRHYGKIPGEFGIDVLLPREALERTRKWRRK